VHGFLFVVGANPRVRPAALSCQTDFEQENNGFLPGRTHGCAPTHFFISSAQIAAAAMRPMLPKNNFLFDKIEKKPVFMRLFSILSARFLFDKIGDNITLQQYIIAKVTVQKAF
jgi:hypothetical protein